MPPSLQEAAMLDGAGYFARLVQIRIPIIVPTALYVVCSNLVQAMMTSAPVMIITEGGPARSTTLIYMMSAAGYQSSNYSLAACISLVTFTLTFGLTLLAIHFGRRGGHCE